MKKDRREIIPNGRYAIMVSIDGDASTPGIAISPEITSDPTLSMSALGAFVCMSAEFLETGGRPIPVASLPRYKRENLESILSELERRKLIEIKGQK